MQRVRELEQRLAASLPREECDALAAELAATKEAAAVAQASFEAALVLAAEAQTQAVETARAEAAQAQAQAVEEARAQAMEEARARLPPLSPDACGKVRARKSRRAFECLAPRCVLPESDCSVHA